MTNTEEGKSERGWPRLGYYRKSIRTEFSLLVAGMMMVLMLVSGYAITNRFVATISQHVITSLLLQARSSSITATNHLISGSGADKLMLNSICNKLKTDNPDIYWVGVAGKGDTLVSHTDVKQVISGATLGVYSEPVDSQLFRAGETMLIRSDTMYIIIPIAEGDLELGRLAIASSMRAMHTARRTSMITVLVTTGLIMLLGLPLIIVRLRKKLHPITEIANGLRHLDVERMDVSIPYESQNEFGYLAETLRVMVSKLHVAQQDLIEKKRQAQEMEIARDIQANLLPRSYPVGSRFEFSGMYRSAKEVGGDYYDFVEFDDGKIAFIIADVSGKSLPGMLVMLLTRDIVKRLSHTVRQPAELLSKLNHELFFNIHEGMFVTMLYGVLNKETGHCVFASAGHNSVIQVDGETGSCSLTKTRGFPLGLVGPEIFEDRIESGELTLKNGDWLVLYTDGINEAQNAEGEQFGMKRLLEAVQSSREGSPDQMISETIERHDQFVGSAEQYDDMTLLVLKRLGEGNPQPLSARAEAAPVHS